MANAMMDVNDIYDSHRSWIGTLDDAHDLIQGGYDGVILAAIWLFFLRKKESGVS
ncbi:MAG: hypothetical protein ACLPX5_02025 [Dissulfurispiraceae bacterium]